MKSVIIIGSNAEVVSMSWTKLGKSVWEIVDLSPVHVQTYRVIMMNDSDADQLIGASGSGWNVLHDDYLTYGTEGQIIYIYGNVTIKTLK